MLSGSPDTVKESILQQNTESSETEVLPVGEEYVLPSNTLEEESKDNN